MKTPMTKLMLAAVAATLLCLGAQAETSDLLAHLSFDDYGNGGTNVLKATVGEDGIVRTTQANVVEGLGAVTPVADAAILAGLPEGDGAVAIPRRSHIALPIPAALASASGKPWSISMKVKFPSFGTWICPLNMPASNSSDAMVYLDKSQTPVICLKQSGNSRVDGSGGFTAGQWETLLFLFDSGRTRVLLNGKEIFNNSCTLAGSRADCANAGGYILLSADNDGDDAFMYWADVRVYDGIVDDTRGWDHATVTWRNYDGTLLATEEVSCGVTPVYKGAKPGKPTSLPSYFVFSGWTEEVVPVTGDVTYTAKYTENTLPQGNTWMVVDLPTGDATYFGGDLGDATNAFNTSEFKTTKMVFRRVPEGLYYVRTGASVAVMGRPYYVGMFPVTVAQYNLMLDPSAAVSETAENLRAVVNVSYATLRGSENVPTAFGGGLGDGPISRLNTRVAAKLGPFDLPTESMWEVAARAIEAGDETHKTWPWFFGASDSLLSQYAFFNGSSEADAYGITSGSRVPGGKLPNAWGLFDIYGNVWERCLDSCPSGQSSETMSLLQVPKSGYQYIRQLGGSFGNGSDRCRASDSGGWVSATETGERSGFRLAMISDELPAYTITWRDYDGTVLVTDKFARSLEGVTPTYNGRVPKRPGHYFAGWSPAVAIVEGDAVYTADYQPLESGQSLVDLSTLAANYTAQDGDVLIDKTTYAVSIADGATVTLAEMSSPGLTCLGDATIVIADNTVNTLSDTLRAGGTNTTLTIQGNTGTLTANGGSNNAGIGGKGQACGNIRIEGGIINATGGFNAAGIGPYYNNNHVLPCGDITITGGTITAVGDGYAAGIGASDTAPCGKILISGGFVTTNGGSAGPGIGGPTAFSDSVCESITISGGTVYATGFATTYYNRSAIGWNCGDICIDATIAKVVATVAGGTPISSNKGKVTIAESLKQAVEGNTLTIENLPSYDITWLDEDGTLLATGKAFKGDIPVYGGAIPVKAHLVLTGWTPAVVQANGDATYTAVYTATCLPDDYEEVGWTLNEDDLSLRSKAIGHSSRTEVHLAVKGPGSLAFKWKVSSERYDYLRFYCGDSQLAIISGETDWATVSHRVDAAGSVAFKWVYTKDNGGSKGSDCGWIKDIVWIPDAQGTQVFVNGASVEFERSEDGKTLTTEVPAGTLATDVPVKVDGVDVSRGFSRKVEGTVFTATLLAPYEVPKEAGAADGIWTENGDGTVTLNVTVVPGLYYAADSAASLDAFKCPGASAPATDATTLAAPKPVGGTGFFKVWVSDAPIAAEP